MVPDFIRVWVGQIDKTWSHLSGRPNAEFGNKRGYQENPQLNSNDARTGGKVKQGRYQHADDGTHGPQARRNEDIAGKLTAE